MTDVRPAFLTSAPAGRYGLRDAPASPLYSFESRLVFTPLSFELENANPTSGGITRRLGLVPVLATAMGETGTSPPNVVLGGNLAQQTTVVITITDVATPGAIEWEYSLNGAAAVSGDPFDQAVGATEALGTSGLTATFPIGTYDDDNVYTSAASGVLRFTCPNSEVDGCYATLMREQNVAITYDRSDVDEGEIDVTVAATVDGLVSGFFAQRAASKQGVDASFANGTLPAVTNFSLGRSLQSRIATKGVSSTVEDLNIGGLLITTDGSGDVTNPGSAYRGTLSSHATRSGTGVYTVTFREFFLVGTVFVAVHTGTNGSATAELTAAQNVVTVTTYASNVATNFASGTIGLFWFAPMSKTGQTNQRTFLESAVNASGIGEANYPVVTNLQTAVVLPFQFEVNGSGDIVDTANTILPPGMRAYRDGTTFTLEIGRCSYLIGFATSTGVARGYAITTTNLASQGRCSFTATLASTIVTGYLIAAGSV